MGLEFVVALLLAVGGSYFAAAAIYDIWGGKSSTGWGWLTAPGEILSSDIQKDFDRGMTAYRAEVSYRYEVSGREYVCNRVFFGDEVYTSDSGVAWRIVRKYRPGAKVMVHYNRQDPNEAVLETGVRWQSYAGLFLGVAAIGFGLAVVGGWIQL